MLRPRTSWGLVVRALLLYGAYKCLPALRAAWARRSSERAHRRMAATNADRRAATAEEMQQVAEAAAEAAAEAQRQQADREAVVADRGAAESEARDAAEAEAAERQRAWLQRLQAQMDEAAAAKAAAERAAAAAAAAAASTATAATAGKSSASTAVTALPPGVAAAAAAAERTAAAAASRPGAAAAMAALARPSSASNMVPLHEAREAEERQRAWLQQLSSPLTPLQAEALERERALKAEQDAAYEAALAEDRRRAEQAAEAEAAATAAAAAEAEAAAREAAEAEATRRRFAELRERLARELPPPPDADAEDAVLVRVRLPDGCSHTRRFAQAAPVQQVRDWLQSLDSFPEWEPAEWSLVSSYPRQVLDAGGGHSVSEVAQGAKQVALFVQRR